MKREPVFIINAFIAFVEAVIALAIGFGWDLEDHLVALLMAVIIAVGNIVKTLWSRNQVTPVSDPRNNEGHQLK